MHIIVHYSPSYTFITRLLTLSITQLTFLYFSHTISGHRRWPRVLACGLEKGSPSPPRPTSIGQVYHRQIRLTTYGERPVSDRRARRNCQGRHGYDTSYHPFPHTRQPHTAKHQQCEERMGVHEGGDTSSTTGGGGGTP